MRMLSLLAACLFATNVALSAPGTGCATPQTYCTAKVAASGCMPSIGYIGTPGSSDFRITTTGVSRGKLGILFLARGQASTPFLGGTLCTTAPIQRIAPQFSTTGIQCSATLSFPFGRDRMMRFGVQTNETLYAQVYFRDPDQADGTGTGLSDGLAITFCP